MASKQFIYARPTHHKPNPVLHSLCKYVCTHHLHIIYSLTSLARKSARRLEAPRLPY